MSFKVDPDALRAWAKWLDGLADDLREVAGKATADASEAFPGTELGASVTSIRDGVQSALKSFASRPDEMADIARGAGGTYEITDDDLAAGFRAMGGLQ
ncbi:type VII secretion target [Nocardia sp. NBC_01503]|uniref:type VII secretion target n=1 Tax=Nocardia sp. NBC_01503 TaxID=2975997 RepID=UPI002E7B2195|nr:type VII secretion target [Nocardia sp. NBC_01503]WTL32622.1 type VII secretion target [Nocardia sp. NBC_01503]